MIRFTSLRHRPRTKRRPTSERLRLEHLEARNLLDGTPSNVLVNNPAEDTIPMQDTQSETAIVLGANSKIVGHWLLPVHRLEPKSTPLTT
jgi:hypothetical protein